MEYLKYLFGMIYDAATATKLSKKVDDTLQRLLNFYRGNADRNDLERYLAEESVSPLKPNFDILSWWKENQRKYKVLSQIARDLLAIQVSTVASKSAFSTGDRILDPFQSSLSPKMVEALICTQNWVKSSYEGIQVKNYLDELQTYENIESEYGAYAGSKALRDVLELDLANMQKAKPKDSPTKATICDRCGRRSLYNSSDKDL
ncbi:hypothetical protein CRYUN_Cryun34aG0048300 [Craigia yunnanensis]